VVVVAAAAARAAHGPAMPCAGHQRGWLHPCRRGREGALRLPELQRRVRLLPALLPWAPGAPLPRGQCLVEPAPMPAR